MDTNLEISPQKFEDHEPESPRASIDIGPRLNRLRKERQWSLVQTSKHTGLSLSALSKIERGELSPTLSSLSKIAAGFDMDVVSLLSDSDASLTQGRRSTSRHSNGLAIATKTCKNVWFAADLRNKNMLPVMTTIVARTTRDYSEWPIHPGEIFVYVLSGKISIYSELYEPLALAQGDTIYYDASSGHKWISTSPDDAEVLWIYASNK